MTNVTSHIPIWHKWRAPVRTFLTLCLCTPLLAGCWDAKEVEHLFYVHAIGLDYRDGNYEVYTQILNPFALSKESGKSEQDKGAWIGRGVGSSYEEALHNLYATTQRQVYWGHLDSVIISENLLAKQGFQEVLDALTRYPETRYTSWIFCTNSPVSKVLLAKPILESSPVYSLLGDPNNVYAQSSFIQPMHLNKFIIRQQEPGLSGLMPEISVTQGEWVDNSESHSEPELSGYGLFRNGKFVGRLSRDAAIGMRWFLPSLPRAIVILRQDGSAVATVTLKSSKRCRIQPVVTQGHLRFNVQIKASGTIVQMRRPLTEKQLESMVDRKIEEDIRQTYNNSLHFGVDIYSLGDSLYRRNPQAFHRFATNDGRLTLSEDSLRRVQISLRIHDSGRTTAPSTRFTK